MSVRIGFDRWLPGAVLLASLTSGLDAQTDLSGDCSGTFTAAGNPHRLIGNCRVLPGETLTFTNGVILEGGSWGLFVDGQLDANGLTFNRASLSYRSGSSGTLENSTLDGAQVVSVAGSTDVNAAAPVLRGNTINATSIGIGVSGTARPTITGNTITSNSWGIRYTGTAGGTASGNVVGFTPEAGNARVGVEINGKASPVVDDNTIEDDANRSDFGITVNIDVDSTARVRNNRICATGDDVPLRLASGLFGLASTAVVSGNQFPCGVGTGIGLYGAVSVDARYEAINGTSSFHLTNGIGVNTGATLTIAPGIAIDGRRHGLTIDGNLEADDVTFTDVFLSFRVSSGGTIENCVLVASSPISVSGNSVVDPADPIIRNNTITASGVGIDVSVTGSPTITGNEITTNSMGIRYTGTSGGTASGNTISFLPEGGSRRTGINLTVAASPLISENTINDDPNRLDIGISLDVGPDSAATVSGNEICSTEDDVPIFLGSSFFASTRNATVSDNTFPCGEAQGFGIGGTLSVDAELRPVNGMSTLYQTRGLNVSAGATLTVASGMIIESGRNGLTIDGNLVADGVTFNDTFFNFRAGSAGTLSHSTITGSSPIAVSGNSVGDPASPILEGNTIVATSVGVDVSGTAQPTLRNNEITTSNIGLRYFNNAGGTASMNTINFTPEGGNSRNGVQINNAASPLIERNTINDDPTRIDIGVLVQGDASSAVIIRLNDICSTEGDRPVVLGAGFFGSEMNATVADNNLVCGEAAGFGVFGIVNVDSQLRPVNGMSTLYQTSTLVVSADATLEVSPEITLESGNHSVVVDGVLNADGATLSDVFLSYRVGGGGTVENCTITGGQPISIGGNSTQNPAAPVIRGNTIVATNIAIDVWQTAAPMISNNEITTNNIGVRYLNTASGTATGNTIGFVPETGQSRRAIEINADASPLVEGNSVLDDPHRNDVGIQLHVNPASTAVVMGNEICATDRDRALDFAPGFFDVEMNATVQDNDLICDTIVTTGLSGNVTTDSVLKPIEGRRTIHLASTLRINQGVTLTVPEGITLEGGGFSIDISGSLVADGAILRNVSFTMRNGSSSTLQNSLIEGTAGTTLSVNGGALAVVGSRFERLSTVFALSGTASVTAEGNLFRRNNVVFRIAGPSSSLVLTDNVFEANTHAVTFQDAASVFSAFPEMLDTNSFQGSASEDTLLLPANLNASGTLRATPVPYTISSGVTIAPNATVTLEPGTVLGFLRNAGMNVNGQLVALGTPERPIIFTGMNLEGGFRWAGLAISNKQSPADVTELRHCVLEFARSGLVLSNASIPVVDCLIADNLVQGIELTVRSAPRIESCTIAQNLGYGILTGAGSTPVIEGCAIFGNSLNGIHNDDASVTVMAENNFWGHDSGPRDIVIDDACNTLSNPDGAGEDVSDCVDYDPWVRVGPSIEGTLAVLSGSGQVGAPGELLPDPLIVEVRSLLGSALADIEVIFSVVEGEAEILEEMPLSTAANGRASATVRLGEIPGDVVIAVTARDVNSPLASFIGETDGPGLFLLKAIGPPTELAGHLPGDFNEDFALNIADVMAFLGHLYGGEDTELPCPGGLEDDRNRGLIDWNGDDGVDLADAVAQLSFLFGGGPPHVLGLNCFEVKGCPGACGD